MSIKNRKVIYKCKVEGYLGRAIVNGKSCGGICGLVRLDNTCGAHGNLKCKNKVLNTHE